MRRRLFSSAVTNVVMGEASRQSAARSRLLDRPPSLRGYCNNARVLARHPSKVGYKMKVESTDQAVGVTQLK
jgi:hypothetical protein